MGRAYKITRTRDLLVYNYDNLDIRCTRDEEYDGIVWLDVCYSGTDVGLIYVKGDNKDFTDLLKEAESFVAGYNRALEDYKGGDDE